MKTARTGETGAKALGWLRNLVLAVFVAALLAGIFLPIYTDEIGWRLQERAAFDGVDALYTQLCGPGTLARPPFWMMPARYYSALFNGLFAAPIYVRLSGILYGLASTALVLTVVRRVAPGARERIALSTLAIGFLSLGVMPLLMVVSRPEQPIVLAFTSAILIALAGWKQAPGDTPARTAWARSLAILALALVAMSYHVKAVATVPLFLVCLALASRGRAALAARALAGAVLVAAAIWAAHYWIDRFACPGDATVRADFVRNTGAAMVSVTDRSQIAPLIAKALSEMSVFVFPGLPAPRVQPMAYWLPEYRITRDQSFLWFVIMVAIWALAYLATVWCLLHAARRAWRSRTMDHRAALSAALLATVLAWSATGFVSVYEASFTLPMLIFAVVLALSTHDPAHEGGARFALGVRLAAAGLGVIGLVSIGLTGAIYGPPLAASAHERGYIKGQPYSINPFGFGALRRDIVAAGRKCGLDNRRAYHALLIDDLTYFPFMQSHLPQHRGGLFIPVIARDGMEYLRSIRSQGIIASCHVLPPAARAKAKSEGSFCCVAPPDF